MVNINMINLICVSSFATGVGVGGRGWGCLGVEGKRDYYCLKTGVIGEGDLI
jgi:hypothetical protein